MTNLASSSLAISLSIYFNRLTFSLIASDKPVSTSKHFSKNVSNCAGLTLLALIF